MDAEVSLQEKENIFAHMIPTCSKWKEIAYRLGLNSDTVLMIEEKGDEPEKALHDVVSAWIGGKDKAKLKGITRSTLIRALKHASVNESELAQKLEESWQKEPSQSTKSASGTNLQPESMCAEEKQTPFEIFKENIDNINDAVSDADTYVLARDFLDAGIISRETEDDIATNKSLNRSQRIYILLRGIRTLFGNSLIKEDDLLNKICLVFHKQENQALQKIAYQMCRDFQPKSIQCLSSGARHLPATIADDFQKYLKERYILRSQQSLNAWPPIVPVEYVNLEIVKAEVSTNSGKFVQKIQAGSIDDVVKANKNISMNLKDMEEFVDRHKFIIVEGAPGIGKTTFANKICQDWARSASFSKFKLVIYIPLRCISLKVANSLADLLAYYYDGESCDLSDVVQYIRKTRGKEVLFVLDGWDELNQTSLDENAFLPTFIRGDKFLNMHIIVTSRPVASRQIRLCSFSPTSKIIQIIGFTEENIRAYIHAYKFDETSNASESLLEELHKYPNVMSACYVAINATIICYVYDHGNHLPDTLTEVYDHFVLHAVKRYIKKSDGQLQDSYDLEARNLKELCDTTHNLLLKLCDLALNGILSNDFSFERRSFRDSCDVSDKQQIFDGFGLVQFYSVGSSSGPVSYCYFLHLTIQEFLAAYSISLKNEREQFEILCKILRDARHPLVLKFFFGLCQKKNRALDAILYTENISQVFLIECVHEAKSNKKCEEFAKRYSNILSISDCSLQPYQALACGSVMLNSSSEKWQIKWTCSHIGVSELKILHQCLKQAPKTLKSIVVKDSEFESEEAKVLMIQIAASQNVEFDRCDCEINGTKY